MMELDRKPNPTKDQHFMTDENILKKICEVSRLKEYDNIVEIGGGAGALTKHLINTNAQITVIEKDPYYAAYLKEQYAEHANVQVVEGDALEFDYSDYNKIVANMPYTITEAFLMRLVTNKAVDFDSATLILPHGTIRKMLAPLSSGEFNITSLISKVFFDLEVLGEVPREAFNPEPSVNSYIVRMRPKRNFTSLDRLLQDMMLQGDVNIKVAFRNSINSERIYKETKNKFSSVNISNAFFSNNKIGNKTFSQLGSADTMQLVEDAIKFDIYIKEKMRKERHELDYRKVDWSAYINKNHNKSSKHNDFNDYDKYEESDEFDEVDEYNELVKTQEKRGVKKKILSKYEYFYTNPLYEVFEKRHPQEYEYVQYAKADLDIEDKFKLLCKKI